MPKQKKESKPKKYETNIIAGKTFKEMLDAAIKSKPGSKRKIK